MSKEKFLAPIIVLLVVAGAYFLLSKKPAPPSVSTETQLPINSPTNPAMTKLQIEDIKIGTGREVKSGDTVVIHYSGTLENGQKFDSSYDRGQPFETQIGVGQVIQGWDQGVLGMKIGGKRKLIVPAELGYGSRGAGNVIPPNSTLIFELELVNIN